MNHVAHPAIPAARPQRLLSRAVATALALACGAAYAQNAPRAPDAAGPVIDEVVVTATRRAEPLSKVAISVSNFSTEEMDSRGVKDFEDLTRLSPGLNLSKNSATGANRIAIRGISSSAGSATTGIYIDDTPIQVTNLGFGAGNAFPGLFDVERVEVLRGPQGTLFGAGSEGGTVRFITTAPSLTENTTYVRSEVSTLRYGSPSYEAGVAVGGPLIPDKLGYRVSAYYRHEGGWIDTVDGNYQILDPTGVAYGNSVAFTRTSTLAEDVNWNRTIALRGALKWQPTDNLTVTPAVFYQKHHLNDGAGNLYDLATSNEHNRNYSRQGYTIGAAGTTFDFQTGVPNFGPNHDGVGTLTLNAIDAPNNAFGDDEFTLSSIGITWDLGSVELASNTSYFDRKQLQWYDYTKGYVQFYIPQFFMQADGVTTNGDYAPQGWKSMARYDNKQGNFVQEFRAQSKDANARLTWLAGAFFSHTSQSAGEPIAQNFLENSPWVGFYPTATGFGYYGYTGGPPFGTGSTAFQNFFGDNPLPGGVSFLGLWKRVDEQTAGFAQVDFKIVEALKFTAGVRVSRNKLDFNASYLAPENNASAPFGFDCDPANAPCVFGQGASAPGYPTSSTKSSETAVTPKFGLSWQVDDANLLYATYAKGFRPAGASLRVPSICDFDLEQNGYVDSNGNPQQPTTYKSDSVWSLEVGSKNRLAGGRLVLDGSIYQIKWKNIQANVSLPNCAYNFVDNLADATSKGADLAFQFKATDHLEFDGALGYNKPTFDHDAKSPGGKVIYNGGSSIPDAGAPWTASLSGEWTIPFASGTRGYVRADYTYTAEWRRYGDTDPGTPYYDARLKPIPAYGELNLRFGSRIGNFDVSLFVQNATDVAPALELSSSTYYDPQDWQNITLRPRTYGVTLTWRH